MRYILIVLGIMLVIGSSSELVHSVKSEGLTGFFSLIITIPFVILGSWLLASGMSKNTAKFGTWSHIKYLIGCVVLSLIIIFFTLVSNLAPNHLVSINGLDIPLGKCMDANVNVFLNEEDREQYCKCVAEKILNNPDLGSEYEAHLVNNRFDDAIAGLQKQELLPYLGLENCIPYSELEWNKTLELEYKQQMLKEVEDSELATTNHIDKYCDCLMVELKKQPVKSVFDGSYWETEEYQFLEEKCIRITAK